MLPDVRSNLRTDYSCDMPLHATALSSSYLSSSGQLPLPSAAEVERFRVLYQEHIGVDLDSVTAVRTLADLVQFYFLTHGHERYRLLQKSSIAEQPGTTSPPIHFS